jgi:hypothetical protein
LHSRETKMRAQAVLAVLAIVIAPARAEIPADLVTAPRAVLCLSPSNLREAVQPAISKDQGRLRRLRCMRTDFGIPITLTGDNSTLHLGAPWQVRVRPQGIQGVTMWGYHSSFALRDGTAVAEQMRRDSQEKAAPMRDRSDQTQP